MFYTKSLICQFNTREYDMNKTELAQYARGVFINMPFRQIEEKYRPLIERYRFDLEIGIDHIALDTFPREVFRETAARLKDLGLAFTIHAPFNEIFLGAPDRLVRDAARQRLDMAFGIIEHFLPVTSVVMHLNYEDRRFGFVYDDWFGHVVPAIRDFAGRCAEMRTTLMLENVYEETPDAMAAVFDALSGAGVGHCLDAGHLSAFSETSLPDWLAVMGARVRQFHLHDNDGTSDAHAPIGTGAIDFGLIRDFIARMDARPVITLEPHSEEDLWATLAGYEASGVRAAVQGLTA